MVALSVNSSLVQRFAWIKAIPELVRDEMLKSLQVLLETYIILIVRRRGKQSCPRQRTVLYLVTTPKGSVMECLFCVA